MGMSIGAAPPVQDLKLVNTANGDGTDTIDITIPAGYKTLKIIGFIETTLDPGVIELLFNDDTTNYYSRATYTSATAITSSGAVTTSVPLNLTGTLSSSGAIAIDVDIASVDNKNTMCTTQAFITDHDGTAPAGILWGGGMWKDTSDIIKISIKVSAGAMVAASEIRVYGGDT